jgi:DNA-binding MarR family transcriptional regulator
MAVKTDEGALQLEQLLCFPLYAATNLLQRLYRPLLAPLGLTYSQYLVMLVLWERGSAYVGELRACLRLDIGTITPLLKRMERAGLLTRERVATDERRVLVTPTAHGLALEKQAATIPPALTALIGMDEAEILELRRRAAALVERLTKVALPADRDG